uniref:Uncharacterized protein n=1 Tax=Anguilla anguilla TaxID=7936 RepID=A0A0E9PW01_ANGAN
MLVQQYSSWSFYAFIFNMYIAKTNGIYT